MNPLSPSRACLWRFRRLSARNFRDIRLIHSTVGGAACGADVLGRSRARRSRFQQQDGCAERHVQATIL